MTTYSDRGFAQYRKLVDTYGAEVKVVESSSATQECVWIFIEGHRPHNQPINNGSAHLNREQAIEIRDALTEWIDTHPR